MCNRKEDTTSDEKSKSRRDNSKRQLSDEQPRSRWMTLSIAGTPKATFL